MINLNRSFLFVPADKPERAVKAAQMPADTVIIELEDGVSPENKAGARAAAGQILAETDFGQKQVALRPNRISTMNGLADLQALSSWQRKPDLLLLPKVESDGEVLIVDALMAEMGVDCEFMVLIESSRGLLNVASIVKASPRITSLSIGSADLSAELGCKPTWEVLYAYRSSLVAACALNGVVPIDAPFLNIKDPDGLVSECRKARALGYAGKLCIHPTQLETVNSAFTPTQEEIRQARKIVDASEAQGSGAIVVDGRMVDKPVVDMAKRTVAMAGNQGGKEKWIYRAEHE